MERERDGVAGVARRPTVPGQRPDARVDEPDVTFPTFSTLPSVPAQARSCPPAGPSMLTGAVAGDEDEAAEALVRARTALGFAGRPALVACRVDVRVELDHVGAVRALTRRTAWEATRNGAESFPVVALFPPPVHGRAEVEALRGCALGPEYVDLRAGICVRALKLREPLSVGQVAEAVHRVRWPVPTAELPPVHQTWELGVEGAMDEVRIEVVFDPSRAPYAGAVVGRTAGREWSAPVASSEGALVWSGAVDGPGTVTLRWEW